MTHAGRNHGIEEGRVSAVMTGAPGATRSLEESVTRGPEPRVTTRHTAQDAPGCPGLPVLMKGHRENLRKEVDV